MCTPTEIAQKARYKVHDFGHYFEVPYTASPTYTVRLPHPLVDDKTLSVWQSTGTLVPYDPAVWELDQRNGIIKIKDPSIFADGIGISGYYYEWFLDEDLEYAASIMVNQHLYDRKYDEGEFLPVECDVLATGAAAQAFEALLSELALDIDVSSPEGIAIPAS